MDEICQILKKGRKGKNSIRHFPEGHMSSNSPLLCFYFSSVQREQTRPHHPAEPPRTSNRRKRGVHRLHSTHAVHGCWRHAPHHAVRGNPRVAPPRGQVAEHPLPPLRLAQYSLPVRDSKDTGHGPNMCMVPYLLLLLLITVAHL